jgi:hypothetical protein
MKSINSLRNSQAVSMNRSKEGSGVVEAQDEDVGKITASVQSSKLKDMLAGLKSE